MQSQHVFFALPINQQIGNAASEYANSIILKSCTALAWNRMPQDRQKMLMRGISDVRRNAQDILFSETFRLDSDELIFNFLRNNEITRKYSLGNCFEYANLALEFIYNCFPNVNAEAYHIIHGDHAFVVIGRLPTSEISKPEEWGPDAYICDPWIGKVYPAAEYRKHLKTVLVREFEGREYNLHISLRPTHLLNPYDDVNTNYLRECESINYKSQLFSKFKDKILCIANVIEYLQIKLIRYAKEQSKCAESLRKINTELKELKEILQEISVERKLDPIVRCKDVRENLMNELRWVVQRFNVIALPLARNEMKMSAETHQIVDNILRILSANLRGKSLAQEMFDTNFTVIQDQVSASASPIPSANMR